MFSAEINPSGGHTMERSNHPTPSRPTSPADDPRSTADPDPTTRSARQASDSSPAGSTRAERQARADWLIAELGRRAAASDNPTQQFRLRRTADSLVRLAIAFRS
jgi:hypothetical protein